MLSTTPWFVTKPPGTQLCSGALASEVLAKWTGVPRSSQPPSRSSWNCRIAEESSAVFGSAVDKVSIAAISSSLRSRHASLWPAGSASAEKPFGVTNSVCLESITANTSSPPATNREKSACFCTVPLTMCSTDPSGLQKTTVGTHSMHDESGP